jgi:hypothetical protein
MHRRGLAIPEEGVATTLLPDLAGMIASEIVREARRLIGDQIAISIT